MRGHGFAAVAVFGGFSACLTWFQPFSAELGTATASGFSLPRRRQSPFTTRLPEAPVRVLHSFKAKHKPGILASVNFESVGKRAA